MSDIFHRIFSAFAGARKNNQNELADAQERPTASPVKRTDESESIASSTNEESNSAVPESPSAVKATATVAEEQSTPESAAPRVNVSGEPSQDELDAYDYVLPERLVAQSPLPRRETARMMVVNRATQKIEHRHCYDIVEYLRPEDALVLNNTKVLPARLIGARAMTGGRWEGLFLQYDSRGFWEIMSKTRGYLRPGEKIELLSSRGVGDTRAPMLIMLFSFVLFRQIYLFTASHLTSSIYPIALGYPVGWLMCNILLVAYTRHSRWEERLGRE